MGVWMSGFLVLLGHLALTGAWDLNFKRNMCYARGLDDLQERMPVSIDNLVALVEKMEEGHAYVNPDAVAEALIHRYRVDGITYASIFTSSYWQTNDQYEVSKNAVFRGLSILDQIVPPLTYEPREECSLHFMLSHSIDLYPHAGLDYVWENYNQRKRREVQGSPRYFLPDNLNPATHPIENGVVWTPSGPVAAGTLLSGIMITDTSPGKAVSQIFQAADLEFMPEQMKGKLLRPLYSATLAGDIGQSALVEYGSQKVTTSNTYLGPTGRFANSTAAPKLFSLESNNNQNIPYLTRAEIFAGIDAMLIQKVMRESSNNQLSLSKALRMYYSNHGLPGYPEYKACNRMNAFKIIDRNILKEQALHFMYAYSSELATIRERISQYKEDFPSIETAFNAALKKAWDQFISFVDNYDYTDYAMCPTQSSSSTSQARCENKVDLMLVYGNEGGETETRRQRDYMAHLAQLVDVGRDRSRVAVMDGKKADWIFHMDSVNVTNMADWFSNFSDTTYFGSGSDMMTVMVKLTEYYHNFYQRINGNAYNASANAQVVIWNAPNSIPDFENFKQLMEDFRFQFPHVYFLFVGKSRGSFNDLMLDPTNDYFTTTTTSQDALTFAQTLATRICQISTVFVYPACNPLSTNFTNFAESSHTYTGYVTPNYTTYIKIPPHYFQYSEKVILKVNEGDVTVCSSRTSMNVDTNAPDRLCHDAATLEWWHLCGRDLKLCDPIYLAVTGTTMNTKINCQEAECQYPNQIKFQLQHEGMTCCGATAAPTSMLLLALSALYMFLHNP